MERDVRAAEFHARAVNRASPLFYGESDHCRKPFRLAGGSLDPFEAGEMMPVEGLCFRVSAIRLLPIHGGGERDGTSKVGPIPSVEAP
jgi:hypothetical protein